MSSVVLGILVQSHFSVNTTEAGDVDRLHLHPHVGHVFDAVTPADLHGAIPWRLGVG